MGRLTTARSPLAPAPAALPDSRRGSARARGYDARWDRASKAFKRANPLCRCCKALGFVAATTVTDHVIPHRGDMKRFWDRAWWQAACDWCHNVVKQILEQMFDAGQITADDLWLDSPVAIEIAKRELPKRDD